MERDEPGLAEFGLADGEDAIDEVDIVGRQATGLGKPQTGGDQQAKEHDIGDGTQPVPGPQAACLLQERSHLRLGVDVGRWAARDTSQELDRWNFGGRVEERAVPGELPHDHQSTCGLRRIAGA